MIRIFGHVGKIRPSGGRKMAVVSDHYLEFWSLNLLDAAPVA